MVPFILFCIYLFRDIQAVSGEATTFISVMKSSGTNRMLIDNSSPTTKDITEAVTTTSDTDIKISGTDTTLVNNYSPTTTDTPTEEPDIFINDIESSGTDTTSDSTTLTDNYTDTTTDSTTSKCEETKTVNISEKYEQLISSKNQLDELFELTMTACHSFASTKSHSTGEFTISLANEYLTKSKHFVESVQLQKTIIRCQNNTASKRYVIDEIDEYEEKLEIVEILSNELGKMMGSETEYVQLQKNGNEQNVTEKMSLFEELHGIVTLNKRVKQLETLRESQYNIYVSSEKIGDLDNLITTLTEMIKIQNKILNIIKRSQSMKYLYDDEHGSKYNMVKDLVNTSNVEGKLNEYETYLIQGFEEHDIEEALLQLNQIIRPFVLGMLFVVGITGNGVLLRVFINHKDMRTAPNIMIINLNICDILGLIFNILLYVIETMTTDWTLGTTLCKLYRFGRYLTIGLSIYSIMVISIQRFLALTDYFSFGFKCRFFGKFQSTLNVLFVWVLASAIASPRAIKAQVSSLVCWTGTEDDREFFSKLLYVDFAVYCALPFLIIAVTSGLSSKRLKSSVKNMPGEAVGQEKVIKARVLSSNIFVALTVVFAICYMPYFVYMTYLKNIGSNLSFIIQKYIAFGLYCLIHSNASFNPIALYLVSAKYKHYMRKYICFTYTEKKTIVETSAGSNTTVDTRM